MKIDLGKWAPYINPDMFDWHKLPKDLVDALLAYRPDGSELEPMSEKEFDSVLFSALHIVQASVRGYAVPYHNISHFREVLFDGLTLVNAAKSVGEEFPRAVVQAFAFALVWHDAYHPGATFRSEAETIFQPEEGLDITNEWMSAKMAETFASLANFNPLARLFITNIIWASTYGATAPRGKELGLERIKPVTFFELAMVVADVAPSDSFVRKMEKGINVLYGERPASPPPDTWSGFLENRIGFLKYYVIPKMDALDAVAKYDLTGHVCWRINVVLYLNILENMRAGFDPGMTAMIKSMLPADRVNLNA